MKIVIALGGNALLRRGEPPEAELQHRRIEQAANVIAAVARDHDVVVTHGNGPQVGLPALQAEARMIGYLLGQELHNRLPGRDVATLITQVVVDGADPAFDDPSKPVGSVYDKDTAERLARERGWRVAPDGDAYRRVVPSPEPIDIVELATIELLLSARTLTVCAGGGGVPVTRRSDGRLHGTEGMIDKDLVGALLAVCLHADMLVLLTDVDAVYRDWGAPNAEPVEFARPETLRALEFATGSMGPKVDAACRFAERTKGVAAIGALEDAEAVVRGERGTLIASASRAVSSPA